MTGGNSSSGSSSEEDIGDEEASKAVEYKQRNAAETSSKGEVTEGEHRRTTNDDAETSGNDGSPISPHSSLPQPEGWRVKLYRLNTDGSWDDCGTGRIVCLYRQQQKSNKSFAPGSDQWLYQETGEATLCVHAEVTKQNRQQRVLLRTRILLRDAYQRQGENIITWCEPYYGGDVHQQRNSANHQHSHGHHHSSPVGAGNNAGVDLALSFQDNAGCLDIWRQITHVQHYAAELMRQQAQPDRVQDMAAQVAAEHHSNLHRQQQQELWGHLTDEHTNSVSDAEVHYNNLLEQALVQSLPSPPTLENLEEIADTIAALQHTQYAPQQREYLALWIAKDDFSYLKQLIGLFPAAEVKGDYGKLATLAACVKTILLLNEPSILELIINVASIFEDVCSCLEYDPDLREKANHRWFLQERAKFRTVVPMEDPELISAIHRAFRVNFLRDTLLRPTMDESALTTLSSLLTFTHADVVKGVMLSGSGKEVVLKDSYLVRVIRLLAVEIYTLAALDWIDLENHANGESKSALTVAPDDDFLVGDPSIVVGEASLNTTSWKQYLAPQDRTPASRRLRKRGCLYFLRELFNMVRISLQPCDKDNFFPAICTLPIDLNEEREIPDNASQTSQFVEVGSLASTIKSSGGTIDVEVPGGAQLDIPFPSTPVKMLSLLASVLSDPHADLSEKSCALEIVSGVTMHDPGLVRICCLEFYDEWINKGGSSIRPEANEKKQIMLSTPPQDLLASLLLLLNIETDAGLLLQVTEVLRVILDTDITIDQGSLGAGYADDAERMPAGSYQQSNMRERHSESVAASISTDQKQFLSLFYEHYISWLVAPFQFTILLPIRRVPEDVLLSPDESPLMQRILATFKKGVNPGDHLLHTVPACATRSSFAVELLSFCVRAHLYRTKFFLLKSRVLTSILKLLGPQQHPHGSSGDRCLKLAALRLLRAILSVNDEFYFRHIIQHDLFDPVFEAFRSNPVGDNLVSSAIIEMCDFIHTENIKSLIEYIVTQHLSPADSESEKPTLEDVSSPYVSTFTVLRKAYESNMQLKIDSSGVTDARDGSSTDPRDFGSASQGAQEVGSNSRHLTGTALEDQRKFQLMDEEESYFESDDDNDRSTSQMSGNPRVFEEDPRVIDAINSGSTH
jgi:protein phosphatase-4 regulatory subunit 3